MRSKVVRTLALALMLCGINLVMGQQNPQGVDEKQKVSRTKEEADRAKHIALFKENRGELVWPEALQLSAFKDSREQLSALMRRAYKSLDSGNNPDPATWNDLQAQYRKLGGILQKNVNEMKPDEYIEAHRYLKKIGETIAALQDPNIGHQSSTANKGIVKAVPPAKSKLEEILAEALKNNPDIRVASANVILAEAELNRIRLQATQKVITLHHAIQSQQAAVSYEQKQYDRMEGLLRDQAVDSRLVEERFAKLTAAKAKLEELEAQMPALLGRVQRRAMQETDGTPSFRNSLEYGVDGRHENLATPASNAPQSYRWSRANTFEFEHAKVTLPQAEKFRKALQTPVKVNFKDVTFDEILKGLSKMVDGLSFRNLFERRGSGHFELPKWSLQFEEAMPVSAILQALEDETGCMFFVREYGIVATTKNGAPLGAMTVEEFLRHKPADESRAKFGALMEGVVNSIDAGGLFTISIGSDVGLAKGQTLELHWKPHKPPIEDARPFGTVRIVEVEAHQAVVQPVGRLSHNPQVGDRIIGSIQKK